MCRTSAILSTTHSVRSCFRKRNLRLARAAKQASLALAVAVLAAACQPFGPGATESPATIAPTPTVAASTVSPGSAGVCAALSPAQVSSLVDQPALVDETSSNAEVCTFAVGKDAASAPTYFIALRREQALEDVAAAKQAFAGGEDVSGLADQAYWSPEVDVLWFETKGELFAVQLINFNDELGDALAVARAVATAALPTLSAGS